MSNYRVQWYEEIIFQKTIKKCKQWLETKGEKISTSAIQRIIENGSKWKKKTDRAHIKITKMPSKQISKKEYDELLQKYHELKTSLDQREQELKEQKQKLSEFEKLLFEKEIKD